MFNWLFGKDSSLEIGQVYVKKGKWQNPEVKDLSRFQFTVENLSCDKKTAIVRWSFWRGAECNFKSERNTLFLTEDYKLVKNENPKMQTP